MGRFVWFEYVTTDAPKAQGFFGELFGWGTKRVPVGAGGYTMIALGDTTIGGYEDGKPGAAPHWRPHLGVADCAASADQVVKLGGQVVRPAMKMGEVGTMAVVRDIAGAELALWQPASPGAEPAPAVGAFTWTELVAADPAAASRFYQALGGFTEVVNETPHGPYHVLMEGDRMRAGIMAPAMPQQPQTWTPYVAVASVDATAAQAKKLGATIYVPPTDIPNVGRFAIFGNPAAAAVGILQR